MFSLPSATITINEAKLTVYHTSGILIYTPREAKAKMDKAGITKEQIKQKLKEI